MKHPAAITVHRVSINPKSDAGDHSRECGGPAQTPAAKNSLASNMNLDVQVSTAPDVALQTSVTQSLQADANLRAARYRDESGADRADQYYPG